MSGVSSSRSSGGAAWWLGSKAGNGGTKSAGHGDDDLNSLLRLACVRSPLISEEISLTVVNPFFAAVGKGALKTAVVFWGMVEALVAVGSFPSTIPTPVGLWGCFTTSPLCMGSLLVSTAQPEKEDTATPTTGVDGGKLPSAADFASPNVATPPSSRIRLYPAPSGVGTNWRGR